MLFTMNKLGIPKWIIHFAAKLNDLFKDYDLHLFCLRFSKQALVFTCLQYKSFENTVGKGEISRNKQFLLFPQCLLPDWRAFCHFHQI